MAKVGVGQWKEGETYFKLQNGKPMANYIYNPKMSSALHEGKMSIG